MTYVIVEPCIGVKDKGCIDVCPMDCIHGSADDKMVYMTLRIASAAAAASRHARWTPSLLRVRSRKSGNTLLKLTPATSTAKGDGALGENQTQEIREQRDQVKRFRTSLRLRRISLGLNRIQLLRLWSDFLKEFVSRPWRIGPAKLGQIGCSGMHAYLTSYAF